MTEASVPIAAPACSGLDPDTVLAATPWCVVRQQPNEYLAYNSRTDELHLLSPSAHYVYLLCNGLNTVDEIAEMVPSARDAVLTLLAGLVHRGLLAPTGGRRLEWTS